MAIEPPSPLNMDSQPLDFEKPILELQRRLQDLKNHSDEHDIDFDSEVESMEKKIRETRRADLRQPHGLAARADRAAHRSARSRSITSRAVSPTGSSCMAIALFGDDKAMPSGLAKLGPHRCVVVSHQKGRDTKENVKRNFGCAHPEGYRKALRLMRLAEKFGLPVIALIDTPGAYPGIGSEERHIAEAIAVNLREMMTSACADHRSRDRRRRFRWRARYRGRRSRPDFGERLLFRHQPGSLLGDFVERSQARAGSGRGAEADGGRSDATWASWTKSCRNRKAARIATTISPRPISVRRCDRI